MKGNAFNLTEYTWLLGCGGGGDVVYGFFGCNDMTCYTLFGHFVDLCNMRASGTIYKDFFP